ncbi:unnamed protein product [Mytilus edulis]|uniref:Uncharacterized protein n=1 Tax=Mytilus edulis TaxID=6550 RepID=A0A8S3VC13_MYTED|nr:unnamed protein product [Mytilus edulis]
MRWGHHQTWWKQQRSRKRCATAFFRERPKLATTRPDSNCNPTSEPTIDPKIINLSQRTLNENEIYLLSKGFKFAPVPYSNVPELKADINNFSRRLRLKEEFGNKKDHDKSLVRNKSTYTPRPGKDDYLDTYIETITKFPVRTRKCKQNLTRNEQDALKSLKDDDSIIIKEADKGGAIIIMDTDFYKEKVLEQLNDEEYYKQITNNPDKATKKRLKKLIKDYDQCLTEKEIAYLCDFDPKESNFMDFPKYIKEHKYKILFEIKTIFTLKHSVPPI